MGWAGGSRLAEKMYDKIRIHIPVEERPQVAWKIKNMFEEYDADDWDPMACLETDMSQDMDDSFGGMSFA